MSVTVEYKEFESVEELKKYCEDVYNENLSYYYIKRTHFWIKLKEKNDIRYTIHSYECGDQLLKSKIGYFNIESGTLYFYIDIHQVCIIILGKKCNYKSFEDKLYHLTHGTNPLSIPDAFKVLSL